MFSSKKYVFSGNENNFSLDIYDYEQEKSDYLKLDTATQAALMEIQGRRREQQDQLAVSHIPGFKELPASMQRAVLKKTIAKLQKEIETAPGAMRGGSTLCAASAWIDASNRLQAVSANVGDSLAYIVIVDENNEAIHMERLNKNLHNLDENNNERRRLRELGYIVGRDMGGIFRTQQGLMLSRAIGDSFLLSEAENHKPEIDRIRSNKNGKGIKLSSKHKVFMVVACDGLTEKNIDGKPALSESQIKSIVAKSCLPITKARDLIDNAYANGSKDNISATIIPVMKNMPAVSGVVFDGHGQTGADISKALADQFYPVLFNQVRKQQKKLLKQQATSADFLRILKEYLANPSLTQKHILKLFEQLKEENGPFNFIHDTKFTFANTVKVSLMFSNPNKENFWHTSTYQKAIAMMKEVYLSKGLLKKDNYTHRDIKFDNVKKREKAFIDYVSGNAPVHFSETSMRKEVSKREGIVRGRGICC